MMKRRGGRYHEERVEKIRREILVRMVEEDGPESTSAKMLEEHDRRVAAGIVLRYRD